MGRILRAIAAAMALAAGLPGASDAPRTPRR